MPTLIFDFDSTFIQCETLETLATHTLKNDANKHDIIAGMHQITEDAMEGQLDYAEALSKKIKILKGHQRDITAAINELKFQITPSFARNKSFFKQYCEHIYILSGGFKEIICPIVESFGISSKHVIANQFLFDYKGNIIGIDANNPLSQNQGKVKVLQSLKLGENSIIIGDGYNDYETKQANCVKSFYAFIENVNRESVVKKADYVINNLEQLFDHLNIPIKQQSNRALLLENIHPHVKHELESQGWDVELSAHALSEEELNQALNGANILGIRSKTVITEKILKSHPQLLAIGAFCIGTNQINLEACNQHGVAVFNAPYSNTRSVVELALCEIIALMRGLASKNQAAHQGKWQKSAKNAHEIRGKKLGIVGYGNIGTQLSVLAESVGMEIYYYDIAEKLPLGNAKRCKSLDKLLSIVDVVSIHVDGRKENANLFNSQTISKMKQGSILLNLSRGHIVDLSALSDALKNQHIMGAAIDVFPEEPSNNQAPFQSTLQNTPNVLLTPHIGGSTEEAQMNIGEFVSERLNQYIGHGSTLSSINFPEIKLPHLDNTHRIIHIHENLPGRLAEINALFGKHSVNIEGQYLQTKDDIGYVITDVGNNYDPSLIHELESIAHTRRVRLLY